MADMPLEDPMALSANADPGRQRGIDYER